MYEVGEEISNKQPHTKKEHQPTEHHSPKPSKELSPFLHISLEPFPEASKKQKKSKKRRVRRSQPEPSPKASKQPEPSPKPSNFESFVGSLDFKAFDNNVKHEEATTSYADLRAAVEEAAEGYIQNSARLTEITNGLKALDFLSLQSRITNIKNTQITNPILEVPILKQTKSPSFTTLNADRGKGSHGKARKNGKDSSGSKTDLAKKALELEPKVRIAGLECNRSVPEGIQFINNKVIETPDYEIFFINAFGNEDFQRIIDIHKAEVKSLLGYMVMAGNVSTQENQRFCMLIREMIDEHPDKDKLKSKRVKLEEV
nr:copia protein [Tanacetum cinerariifolium]